MVAALENDPASWKIEVAGFIVHREPGLGTVAVQRSDKGSFRPAIWVRAKEALDKILPTKNDQLSVVEHERVVLVVGSGYLIADDDVGTFTECVRACRHLYVTTLRNIDKIYFERRPNSFDLVFDRGA